MSLLSRSMEPPGQVPSTFAPSVSQSDMPMTPATSPWVSPMRNSAPGLMQQTGQALAQAGDVEAGVGNTIGDRVQETMDDAQTKAAETQFLGAALPILGQYKTTEGINATQQWDPASQAIVKARQDARATLTNPIQQHMFDQVTNDHLLTFGQQMADHENVQRVQYGKDQAKARAESLNTMSTLDVAGRNREDSNFAKFGAQSDAEVLHYAGLSGIAPDSPQAEQMLRQNRTQRYRSVITSLLDQHAYNEASDFFNEHQPEMDIQQAEILGNAVKAATKAEQVTEFRNQAIQSLQKTPGAGPLTQPIPAGTISTTEGVDGIDIHTAPGTNVHAPASGTVTKIWTNPQQGLSAQITLPSGYTATFSGLGAVNYKEGQKITGGQVLGLSGQDDHGQGVTHYAMTDATGAYVDPRQAASAPYDPKNFSTPEDEEQAVQWINKNVQDPVQQREAESQVRSLANMNRQIGNQEHAAALKQATDFWFQNGQSIAGLPAQVKMQLTPEDLDSFNQKAYEIDKRNYDFAQLVREQRGVSLQASWNADPSTLTIDAVRQAYAQGQLSDTAYLASLRRAQETQADPSKADGQKVLAAQVDNQQIENTLLQNGRADIVNATPKTPQQQAQKVALWQEIRDQIDAEQQVSRRELTRDQKQAIIDSTVLNSRFLKTPGWFGSSSAAPWELTPAAAGKAQFTSSTGRTVQYVPMPAAARPAAIQSLIQRRQPINEQNIYDTWVNAGMVGAPRQGK